MTTIVTSAEPTTREDLQDIVYNASERITNFISAIGQDDASATLHEWPVDAFEKANTNKAKPEGEPKSSDARAARLRPGNFLQINDRTIATSGTIDAVDIAGVTREHDYQVVKAGTEVMKDVEAYALSDNPAITNGGPDTNARQAAGLECWLKTNIDHGGGGSTDDWASGGGALLPGLAPTDGTPRAFTEDLLQDVLELIWSNSDSRPSRVYLPPAQKRKLSNFDSASSTPFAGNQVNQTMGNLQQGAILRGIEYYMADWWDTALICIPNRHVRPDVGDTQDTVFVVDTEYVSIAYLRRMREEALAKTGDNETTLVIAESTLCVKDELAHGKVADLSR